VAKTVGNGSGEAGHGFETGHPGGSSPGRPAGFNRRVRKVTFADAYPLPQERQEAWKTPMSKQTPTPGTMKIQQWEIWKSPPPGFLKKGPLGCDRDRTGTSEQPAPFPGEWLGVFHVAPNGPLKTDVRLNSADGFESATVCQCDLLYFLDKNKLHSPLECKLERQQLIKSKLKEVFRL